MKYLHFIVFFVIAYHSKQYAQDNVQLKVDSLIELMTLQEKIGQLNQYTSQWEMTGPVPDTEQGKTTLEQLKSGKVGSMLNVTGAEATRKAQELVVENSRLGIPLLFGYDVIHGYQTMFPIPLGEASSWDPDLVERTASIAAKEAAAAGIHWTFAPMVDISRDARWGRVMEGSGEDTYLGSLLAAARVKGFQGDNLNEIGTIAACAKHFAAYGFAESGKDYNTVDISDHTLHNVILPPFKACVDAGVATFMNAFNEIGGIPSTSNSYLLRDVLKEDWNFNGFVVSDWNSIGELIQHGVAQNKEEAARLAMLAGSDMDMEGRCYIDHLEDLVVSGKIDENRIDDAVRRVLTVKYKLGLFDDPYKYSNTQREEEVLMSEENRQIAYEAACKSIVLLKNENDILPLQKEGVTIAVMGELATEKDSPLGSWRARAISNSAVSLLEGVSNTPNMINTVKFTKGYKLIDGDKNFAFELVINTSDRSGFEEAKNLAGESDIIIMALGENCFQSGEGRSQSDISLKGLQKEFFDEIYAINKNIVVVLMNGRPLVLDDIADKAGAIIEAWHLGSESGNAIASVLFGDVIPSGKLPVSFPRSVGQCPIYYNYKNTGRPSTAPNLVFYSHYTDESNQPLYPFGYGLSYTTFNYSEISLSKEQIGFGKNLDISVDITNTGNYEGIETVQLYIRDMVASVTRPVKELKGFKKINLKPGETKTVTFLISDGDLSFYNANNKLIAEPGEFKIFIGTNSQDVKEASFLLKE